MWISNQKHSCEKGNCILYRSRESLDFNGVLFFFFKSDVSSTLPIKKNWDPSGNNSAASTLLHKKICFINNQNGLPTKRKRAGSDFNAGDSPHTRTTVRALAPDSVKHKLIVSHQIIT